MVTEQDRKDKAPVPVEVRDSVAVDNKRDAAEDKVKVADKDREMAKVAVKQGRKAADRIGKSI